MSESANEQIGESRHKSSLFLRLLLAGGLFTVSFILYLSSLAPSVVTLFDDSLEFQLVTYRLGIAHPPGYPLFTLLGKLFTWLVPIGNIAYRVNLMSAFFGAATVALLYLLILQIAAPKQGTPPEIWPLHWSIHLGGVIGALLLAVSSVFWQQATIAEVYTLNAFFVVILLLLAIRSPWQGGGKGELGLALFAGLSLTHHRTMLLLFPALALYLFLTQKHLFFNSRRLFLSILLGLIPFLLYLYLPWRGHVGSLDGTYENTWAGFWRQVSASGYSTFIFDNPFDQARNATFYWNLFKSQFYSVVPGFIGLFYLFWVGQHKFLILTGTAFLTYFTFNLFYKVSDIEVFFMPPFLIWAAWSGAGTAFLLQIVTGMTAGRREQTLPLKPPEAASFSASKPEVKRLPPQARPPSSWGRTILVGAIIAIFAFILFQLFQAGQLMLKARNTWQVHDYGLDMLQQPLPPQSAIVGILGEMTLLRYFQQTENRRPDIETVAADLEADRLAAVEKLLAHEKSVYLTRELPGAPERWSLSGVGPLIQVNPQPVMTPPEFEVGVNQSVTAEITLLGYRTSRPPHSGPGLAPLRLTLFWQTVRPLTENLKVSARLLNGTGEVVAVVDAIPVRFAYPTTAWRRGEIVADVYDLTLPVDTPPGSYTPLLIWYDPAQNAAEVGRIELAPVVIE